MMAVSACGPGHLIKLYDRATLSCMVQLAGHSSKVNEVHFSRDDPNILYSASSDSTLKLWDIRQPTLPVHSFSGGGKEFWTADMNSSGVLLGAGMGKSVRVVDLRTRKVLRTYSEAHTDDVTQARFHPAAPSQLVTGSVDGLACVLDCDQPRADDALAAVLSVGVSISRIGFAGPAAAHLYCLTHSEGLQLWAAGSGGGERLLCVDDMRPALAAAHPGMSVDYLLDCRYDAAADALYLFAGSATGAVGIWHVTPAGAAAAGALADTRGHTETVRGFDWDPAGRVVCTGGEDCRIIQWTSDSDGPGSPAGAGGAAGGEEGPGKVRSRQRQGFTPY